MSALPFSECLVEHQTEFVLMREETVLLLISVTVKFNHYLVIEVV